MAQTGYTPIYLYYSGTSTHVPLVASLGNGELAINAADGNLFYKNTSNQVVTVPLLQASGSQNGWLSSIDWTTFNNKGSGSVTSVGGTGSVSGITLTGTVTSSGNLTLGGTLTLASPPTIGNTTPNTGAFTTLSSNGNTSFSGANCSISIQPTGTGVVYVNPATTGAMDNMAIGATTASTGKFTSTTSGNVQISSNSIITTNTNGNLTIDPNGSGYTVMVGPTNGTVAQFFDLSTRSYYFKFAKSGGYDNDTLVLESDSGVGQYQWKNSGATLATLSYAGDYTIPGNIVIGTSGKGIDFSATAGTGTSELLADYEEGTWTPAFTSTGTAPIVTYAKQTGYYRKVGSLVTCVLELQTSAVTAGTGNMQISGLPYTSASGRYQGTVSVGYSYAFGTYAPRAGTLFSSSSTVTLTYFDANNSQQEVAVTNLATGASSNYLIATIIYIAA